MTSIYIAIAGGGGSSSGGGSSGSSHSSSSSSSIDSSHGGSSSHFDPVGFAIFVIFIIIFFVVFRKVMKSGGQALAVNRAKQKARVNAIAAQDGAWLGDDALVARVKELFVQFQADWSQFSIEPMKGYLSERYYNHIYLMLAALKLAGRQNDVSNAIVHSVDIIDLNDSIDNSRDTFRAIISFSATDTIKDIRDNSTLYTTQASGTETYRFVRSGDSWLLDGIDQPTASLEMRSAQIAEFATKQDMYYSLDWGYLLLPRGGQLFSGATYGVSDINNHTIGLYHDMVVQVYSYIQNPSNTTSAHYVIAQTALPKSYGDILVRQKSRSLFRRKPRDLYPLKTEWGQFNDKYEVFASDMERATSFDLLMPDYMEQLEAVRFGVNIEVIDNILYLYTTDSTADYGIMLELLKNAFKELKL